MLEEFSKLLCVPINFPARLLFTQYTRDSEATAFSVTAVFLMSDEKSLRNKSGTKCRKVMIYVCIKLLVEHFTMYIVK